MTAKAALGLMTAELNGATFADTLDAVVRAGASSVQLDLASVAGESFPRQLPEAAAERIREELSERGLTLAALSGTYNMIHPSADRREAGAADLDRLIAIAPLLGARVVSLCTGTRDPEDMWRKHPGNDSPAAWDDLLRQLERALRTAERHDIVLGVEPEVSNTVNSVEKARRLLDHVGSPHLKIIMDGANVFPKGTLPRMRSVLDEAFRLLGADIVLAHAKDLDRDGDAGHLPAGTGKLDYPHYLRCLMDAGFTGSIVLHSLAAAEAAERVAFVRGAAPGGYVA